MSLHAQASFTGMNRVHPPQIGPKTSLSLGSSNPETSLTVALMPWKETDAVKQRVKVLLEWESRWRTGDGRTNFAWYVTGCTVASHLVSPRHDVITRPRGQPGRGESRPRLRIRQDA
jgi:hypothetical protein